MSDESGSGSEWDWSCTDKCRSHQHGSAVCGIARRGDDRHVLSLWESTCRNYSTVKDSFGRSALHVAASTPNPKAVEWLVRKDKSMLNGKELLSGYTPLHRAIYFGQIQNARNLIASGASLRITDNEGLNPIDLCLADRLANLPVTHQFRLDSDPTELYIWGTNDNFNLGTDNQSARKIPEPLPLDRFRARRTGTGTTTTTNTSISHVNLQNFHSVFLGQNGQVFSCGVGTNGRLGLGDKETVAIAPHPVPLKEPCTQVAAGTDHVLFLLNEGIVKSCGWNENFVLGHDGHPFPLKVSHPRTIQTLRPVRIQGVRASSTHSVFFTNNRLYTCGLNEGQLGHFGTEESHVILPTLVTCVGFSGSGKEKVESDFGELSHVECNDFATVVRTHKGNLTLLYRNEYRKIPAQHLALNKVVVTGGQGVSPTNLDHTSTTSTPLTLFLLTVTGSLVIWREDVSGRSEGGGGGKGGVGMMGTFTQVVMDLGRTLTLKDIGVSRNSWLGVTNGGEAFMGPWTPSIPPITTTNRNSAEEREKRKRTESTDHTTWVQSRRKTRGKGNDESGGFPLEHMKMRRVPNIHAGESVACDPKGNNFAIIQRYHKMDFVHLPTILPSTWVKDLERLYQETSLDDILHDVVFDVRGVADGVDGNVRSFPAHRFILATGCPQLYNLVKEGDDAIESPLAPPAPLHVRITTTHPFVFEQLLSFIYTGTCSLLNVGTPLVQTNSNGSDWIRLTLNSARQFKLESLAKKLNQVHIVDGMVKWVEGGGKGKKGLRREARGRAGRKSHGELTDVVILSSDNQLIPAHRCILVARMDYFDMMMSQPVWRESTSGKIALSVKRRTIEMMLDWVYEERVSGLLDSDSEAIAELFMATDLFGMDQLRAWVEVTLAETISLKNVAQLLTQSIWFNAHQLRDSAFNFIALNLSQLLENRLLDGVENDVMGAVGVYYRVYHPQMNSRQLHSADNVESVESLSPQPHPHSSSQFEQFLLNYDEEEMDESDYQVKGVKPKARRVRNRTRTVSSGGEGEPHPDPVRGRQIDEGQPPLLPSPIPIPIHSSSPSHPTSPPQSPQSPLCGGNGSTSVVLRVRDAIRIQSSIHFPSLSKLIPHSEHFEPLTTLSTSPPSSSFKMGGGKKKIKWKSIHEPSTKTKTEMSSPPERDPTNPWQKFKTESDPNPITSPHSPQIGTAMDGNGGDRDRGRSRTQDIPFTQTQTRRQINFNEIVKEEEEMKENLMKATHKPLRLLQIEELGIEQLRVRYRSEKTEDGTEILDIQRVCQEKYASPSWPHSSPQPINTKPKYAHSISFTK